MKPVRLVLGYQASGVLFKQDKEIKLNKGILLGLKFCPIYFCMQKLYWFMEFLSLNCSPPSVSQRSFKGRKHCFSCFTHSAFYYLLSFLKAFTCVWDPIFVMQESLIHPYLQLPVQIKEIEYLHLKWCSCQGLYVCCVFVFLNNKAQTFYLLWNNL